MKILALGYLGFSSPRYLEWKQFGPEVLGLAVTEDGEGGSVRLRMDERHHRITIHPGELDNVEYMGWELQNRIAFEAALVHLEAKGYPPTLATPLELESRRVCNGLGHRSRRLSDAHRSPRAIGILSLQSAHACAGYAPYPGLKGIQHVGIDTLHLDDVGTCLDLCTKHHVPLSQTLGRNVLDESVSFYMLTPGGFELEYGFGATLYNEGEFLMQTPQRYPHIWGHVMNTKSQAKTLLPIDAH